MKTRGLLLTTFLLLLLFFIVIMIIFIVIIIIVIITIMTSTVSVILAIVVSICFAHRHPYDKWPRAQTVFEACVLAAAQCRMLQTSKFLAEFSSSHTPFYALNSLNPKTLNPEALNPKSKCSSQPFGPKHPREQGSHNETGSITCAAGCVPPFAGTLIQGC